MFTEVATTYLGTLQPFCPLSPITQRENWEALDPSVQKQLLAAGDSYLGYSYPPLPASLFHLYTANGNRIQYEDAYFARRRALNALVLAECVADDGRYMPDILNGIFAICEESGWQLPAHNNYVRDSVALPYPDATHPILDLFACETGALLATVAYLLGDKLQATSPVIETRIRHELQQRIYTPYLTTHFWWMGRGEEPMNNWTIWCTQNVLLATFILPQEEALKEQVFHKACTSVDYFLKEYGEDGCCDEGPQYYRHAGLCLFNTLEVLNGITNGHFNALYKEPKIQNIATYILKVHVAGDYYINFADASPKAGDAGIREFLFGKHICHTGLMSFAKAGYLKSATPLLPMEINLFYRLQAVFTHKEIMAYVPVTTVPTDVYFPSNGLFITRDTTYCLALKAGDNDDSHNHNDTGSFTIYKDGQPFLIDIGVENYTKQTFSADRYKIWTMQSDYHNLPTINRLMQHDGAQYKASGISTTSREDASSITCDLARAYPNHAGIESYLRTATLQKGSHVTITDKVIREAQGSVISNLLTQEKPVLVDRTLQVGTLGEIRILSDFDHLEIEALPITDSRLLTAWPDTLYRTRIYFTGSTMRLEIQ